MILPYKFKKQIAELKNDKLRSVYLIFDEDELLVQVDGETVTIPEFNDEHICERIFLGSYNNLNYYSARLKEHLSSDTLKFKRLRKLYKNLADDLFYIAGYALFMNKWHKANKFCTRCGSIMDNSKKERAKICTNCSNTVYPQLSQAVIVAVIKDNEILLGHNIHFPKSMYSVLAGYVDPGEDLETCVSREIKEEANIEVQNIRYFGSQFWPFSDSMMIGFTAEYKSGEIKADEAELEDVRWFKKEEIPMVPDDLSISRQLINWFIST